MRFQASFLPEAPLVDYVHIFGPMDWHEENGQTVYITRGFASLEHLKALCGTFQGRLERAGVPFTGACIQPHGAKPPAFKGKYKVVDPLKVRLDYDRGTPFAPKIYDLRPPNQGYYEPRMAAEPLKHPETVIVPPNEHYPQGLTEQQITDYYKSVQPRIVQQYVKDNLDGAVVTKVDDKVLFRRHASVDMAVHAMDLGDKQAFDRLNNGRTVEFHFAVGDKTKFAWVDLDPGEEFPWEDLKSIARDLTEHLWKVPECGSVEIRFSGRRGFHIMCVLKEGEIPTTEAKSIMDKALTEYIDEKKDDRLTTKVNRDPKGMRLDDSTLHKAGGLRTPWSLAYPTGLVCLPLHPKQLDIFKKGDATMENALKSPEVSAAILAKIDTPTDLWRMISEWRISGKLPEDVGEPGQVIRMLEPTMGIADPVKMLAWLNERFVENNMELMSANELDQMLEEMAKAIKEKGLEARAAVFDNALAEYREKRTPGETPEPVGEVAKKEEPIFVIQKHAAHKAGLHFDFRLAQEGVLKSWAIPKLMDLVQGKKDSVLAVEVEPHPLDYAKFEGSVSEACEQVLLGTGIQVEGSIPAGQYGGGEISIWDNGQYETISQDDRHWKFRLNGSNIKGTYVLARTEGNKWLLRRGKDADKS